MSVVSWNLGSAGVLAALAVSGSFCAPNSDPSEDIGLSE